MSQFDYKPWTAVIAFIVVFTTVYLANWQIPQKSVHEKVWHKLFGIGSETYNLG